MGEKMEWSSLVKELLPHLAELAIRNIPKLTKRASNNKDIVPDQISELQDVVTNNAEAVKILASQLEQVINGIEASSTRVDKQLQNNKRVAIVAIVLSCAAISLWAATWFFN